MVDNRSLIVTKGVFPIENVDSYCTVLVTLIRMKCLMNISVEILHNLNWKYELCLNSYAISTTSGTHLHRAIDNCSSWKETSINSK